MFNELRCGYKIMVTEVQRIIRAARMTGCESKYRQVETTSTGYDISSSSVSEMYSLLLLKQQKEEISPVGISTTQSQKRTIVSSAGHLSSLDLRHHERPASSCPAVQGY